MRDRNICIMKLKMCLFNSNGYNYKLEKKIKRLRQKQNKYVEKVCGFEHLC